MDINLVTGMDMVVGTVSIRVFVSVGSLVHMLMQVSVAMLVAVSMPMFVFMCMDFAVVGVFVSMTMYVFVRMFMRVLVRPFHVCFSFPRTITAFFEAEALFQ